MDQPATDLQTANDPASLRALRNAMGRFATGVALITTMGDAGPAGFTANSFASVSLDPPLVLWSPARSSSRFQLFTTAPHFSIHVLAAGDMALAHRFARGGHGFATAPDAWSAEGAPIFPQALARFDCRLHATHDGGDHLIVVGRVLRFSVRSGEPLVFSQGRYGGFSTPD